MSGTAGAAEASPASIRNVQGAVYIFGDRTGPNQREGGFWQRVVEGIMN